MAISEASSSLAQGSMSTSPLKRMERRIKGSFKCILGKKKQLDHRLSRLESHIYHGEHAVGDAPPPDLEGDSEELDDCVDEDAFSSKDDGERSQPRHANTHFVYISPIYVAYGRYKPYRPFLILVVLVVPL